MADFNKRIPPPADDEPAFALPLVISVFHIMETAEKKYSSFRAFYPYYLTEHSLPVTQALHFTGTLFAIGIAVTLIIFPAWRLLLPIPAAGYGFAWAGHFFFEKNRPATFRYPLYSLAADFVMFFHILTGQIGRQLQKARELQRAGRL